MTPSRSAHGQTSSAGRSNRSITASATIAPATSCGDRPADTPGSSARSAADILVSFGIQSLRSSRFSPRGTYGPSSDGAAPQIRASERNVLLVATARCGLPARSTVAGDRGHLDPDPPAQRPDLVLVRRVGGQPLPGQPAGAERDRHGDGRLLVGPGRDLQRAAADVEHRQPTRGPAEPAAYGEEGQPRLVLTGQHLQVDPGLACGPGPAPSRRSAPRAARRWRTPAPTRSPCPRPARPLP